MVGHFWVFRVLRHAWPALGGLSCVSTPLTTSCCCAAQVTGFRGEFGPAERAGVQVGWEIIGVSGTAVDSKETLAGERISMIMQNSSSCIPVVCPQRLTWVSWWHITTGALDLMPDGEPVDFLFRVPEELGSRRRGRGRNEEIARFQHRGESGGIF